MIDIVKYPSQIVNGQVSEVSKWNAVHHPIQFHLQRKDKTLQSIARFSSTEVTAQINGTMVGGVGSTVYVSSANGVIAGTGVVSSIIYSGTPYSIIRITLSTASLVTQIGGWINFVSVRTAYRIETKILGVNAVPAYYEIGTSINQPDETGLAKVDAAAFLKTILTYKNDFTYDVLNAADFTMGGQFNIQYREEWTGTTGAWSGISSVNLYYYVNASKQVQELYGANMGEYVPFETAFSTEPKAKFLSDFRRPTYFPGFPFSLGFIYSDKIAGKKILKHEQVKDANGVAIATSSIEIDRAYLQQVNRLMINGDYECSQSGTTDVWLETDGIGCREYVAEDYVAEDYVEERCGPIEVEVGDAR